MVVDDFGDYRDLCCVIDGIGYGFDVIGGVMVLGEIFNEFCCCVDKYGDVDGVCKECVVDLLDVRIFGRCLYVYNFIGMGIKWM